jgi:hypothetical protein
MSGSMFSQEKSYPAPHADRQTITLLVGARIKEEGNERV